MFHSYFILSDWLSLPCPNPYEFVSSEVEEEEALYAYRSERHVCTIDETECYFVAINNQYLVNIIQLVKCFASVGAVRLYTVMC